MKYVFLPILPLALAACENLPEDLQPKVRDATAAEVAGCTAVGTVQSVPKVFGPLKRVGLEDGKRAARASAAKEGANRIVFDPINTEADVFVVTGTAYRC